MSDYKGFDFNGFNSSGDDFGRFNGVPNHDFSGFRYDFSDKKPNGHGVFEEILKRYVKNYDSEIHELGKSIDIVCRLGKAQAQMINTLQEEIDRLEAEIKKMKIEHMKEMNRIDNDVVGLAKNTKNLAISANDYMVNLDKRVSLIEKEVLDIDLDDIEVGTNAELDDEEEENE